MQRIQYFMSGGRKKLLMALVISFFLAQSFTDSSLIEGNVWEQVMARFPVHGMLLMLLPFGVAMLMSEREERRFDPILGITSGIFGFLNACGQQMYYTDHLPTAVLDWFFMSGYVISAAVIFYYIAGIVINRGLLLVTGKEQTGAESRKLFGTSFLIILAGWLVWIIPYYPASAEWDVYYPIAQYLGFIPKSNQQPWFYCTIVGFFYRFGVDHADKNAGMYLYIMLRAILMSLIYARLIVKMQYHKISKHFIYGTILFYAFVPVWGAYAKHAFKDTMGAALFCWYMTVLVDMVLTFKEKKISLRSCVEYAVASTLCALIRNNFIYVVFPITVLLLVFFIRSVVEQPTWRKALGVSLLWSGILVFVGYEYYIYHVVGVDRIPVVEALSIPMQQSARVVRDHDREIDPETRLRLSSALVYEELADTYDPLLADPVKYYCFRRDADIAEYLSVWSKMFWRFPKSYVEAAIGESFGYYAFVPDQIDYEENPNSGMAIFDWTKDERFNSEFTCDYIDSLEGTRKGLHLWSQIWHELPGVGLLDIEAFYTWMIVIAGVICLRKKALAELIPVFAMLLMVASCCLSPINDCFRYYAPVAAASPTIILLMSAFGKRKDMI